MKKIRLTAIEDEFDDYEDMGRREGRRWSFEFDLTPYVVTCAMACAITGLAACGIEAAIEVFFYKSSYQVLLLLSAGIFVLAFALGEAGLMSTAARCKAHTLLRNTVMWKLCKLIGHCFRAMGRGLATIFGRWQLTHRVVILFLLYLVGTVLTGCTIILILPSFPCSLSLFLCIFLVVGVEHRTQTW